MTAQRAIGAKSIDPPVDGSDWPSDGGGRTWHGHDRYAANLRRVHGWFREVWFGADDMAQALRARVMPLFAEDPLRIPDFIGAGPDAPRDEAARGVLRRRLG